jgi:hypothetical protein
LVYPRRGYNRWIAGQAGTTRWKGYESWHKLDQVFQLIHLLTHLFPALLGEVGTGKLDSWTKVEREVKRWHKVGKVREPQVM